MTTETEKQRAEAENNKFKLFEILDKHKEYEIEILKYNLECDRSDKSSFVISLIISTVVIIYSMIYDLLKQFFEKEFFIKYISGILFIILLSIFYVFLVRRLFKTGSKIYEAIIEYEYLKNEDLIKETNSINLNSKNIPKNIIKSSSKKRIRERKTERADEIIAEKETITDYQILREKIIKRKDEIITETEMIDR